MLTETLGDKKNTFCDKDKNSKFFSLTNCFVGEKKSDTKFRVRETPKLSTDADRRIDTERKLFFWLYGRTN